MAWRTSTVETERARFVIEAELSELSHAELCRRFNISRVTGYKWLERYQEEGIDGLRNRSHRPHSCPHSTSPATVQRILVLRKRFGWGARTIRGKLARDPAIQVVPSADTIGRILHRHSLIEPRKPRRRRTHPGPPVPILPEPNGTWTADFKGEFRTRDGKLCYPLTVQDGHSRFLLACQGMPRIDLQATLRSFRRLFREFGLPRRIRTDNGPPFATTAIAGLSQLSVWWISLGIVHERIEPGKPHQNGRHERMHWTLKKRTAIPPHGPRANLSAQQRRFDHFRRVYNFERPHEALHMQTPADLYQPSSRRLPARLEPVAYPSHFEVRRVSGDHTLRWKSRKVFVSTVLKGHHVGLETIGDGVHSVFFGPLHLGWLDERDYRIMDIKDRTRRRR
jgi:putative transposase